MLDADDILKGGEHLKKIVAMRNEFESSINDSRLNKMKIVRQVSNTIIRKAVPGRGSVSVTIKVKAINATIMIL